MSRELREACDVCGDIPLERYCCRAAAFIDGKRVAALSAEVRGMGREPVAWQAHEPQREASLDRVKIRLTDDHGYATQLERYGWFVRPLYAFPPDSVSREEYEALRAKVERLARAARHARVHPTRPSVRCFDCEEADAALADVREEGR